MLWTLAGAAAGVALAVPVSYLVQRAVSWGHMPLDTWLAEVIKDGGVLDNLRETLGIKKQ